MADGFDPDESEAVITVPGGWKPQTGGAATVTLNAPTRMDWLDDGENTLLAGLADVWARHSDRNRTLTAYYEAKEPLADFGLAVPDAIKRNYTPLGWARKAVDMLAELVVFDGFVAPGVSDPWGLNATLGRAGFPVMLQQAVQTALIHGCSFLAVLRDARGAPVLRTHTAENAAALWDWPNRRVKACMAVTDMDGERQATGVVLYLPTRTVSAALTGGVWVMTGSQPVVGDGCGVTRLAYKPTESKPFGRSRISPDAMRLIDAANRTLVRAEANAEYYAFPKIFLLGASEQLASMGTDEALRLYMGRYNIITKDTDGDSPQVTQLAASSMDPHLTMFKTLASSFAASMNIPAASLGVVADSNPTSAEAVDAQREDLIVEAQRCDRDFGQSLLEVARHVARVTNPGVTDAELDALQADWRNPNTPSASMSADAFTKLASAIPGFATSDVGWARAGLSRGEIIRLQAVQDMASADTTAARILTASRGTRETTNANQSDGGADNGTGGNPGRGGVPSA